MKNTLCYFFLISGLTFVNFTTVRADTEMSTTASTLTVKEAEDKITPIITAYKKEYERIRLIIIAEKDLKKRMARFRKELPRASKSVDLILKLAKENPMAKGVEEGLLWSLKGNSASPTQRKEINNLFLTHYKDSESLMKVAMRYASPSPGGEEARVALRGISEKAGDQKVRIRATYFLANNLMKDKDEANKKEGLAVMKKLATTPDLENIDPEICAYVKGEILVVEKLAVGCTPPDIVGTDHDGKEFKLSDYRGKVVLLHFWGIW